MQPEISLPCSQEAATTPFLSQMNPIYTLASYFFKLISVPSSDERLALLSVLFPSYFRSKLFLCNSHLPHRMKIIVEGINSFNDCSHRLSSLTDFSAFRYVSYVA